MAATLMPPMDDEKLLRQAGQGDSAAFAALVARYEAPLLHFIRRYLRNFDVQTAEDLAQSVFLAAWQGAASFKPQARVRTWLYRIAINACLNERRRRRARGLLAFLGNRGSAAESASLAADVEADERGRAVRAALASLPESQRAVMVLRHYHGFSYAEIAEVLEVSVSAVESLLVRARQNLRRALLTESDETGPQGSTGSGY